MWSVVIFLIMLITCLMLWLPAKRRLIKQSLNIKWRGSFKRINFDLHQVLGFYASIILIVIAFSGTYFAFNGVKKAVAFVSATKLREGVKNKDTAIVPFTTLTQRYDAMNRQVYAYFKNSESVIYSVRKSGELRIRILYPYRFSRKQNTFFFDQTTGKLLRIKLYKDNTAADWYEATNYDLHTGRLSGYSGKII